ncbi:MAG: YIP1 family protein [Gemmatimonadota bacterium]|nr:YIP1 family protein [Gemmatimonadota bacterium]
MEVFKNRVIRAMKLDASLYEEVEADRSAMGQAVAVVIIASVANGIGTGGLLGFHGIILGTVASLIGWVIWALTIYVVGTKILPTPQTRSDPGELLRCLGFANAPGFLSIFGMIPILGVLVRMAVSVWMLCAMVVAVRQALDYTSTGRAIAVCLIGWLFYVIAGVVIFMLLGGMSSFMPRM